MLLCTVYTVICFRCDRYVLLDVFCIMHTIGLLYINTYYMVMYMSYKGYRTVYAYIMHIVYKDQKISMFVTSAVTFSSFYRILFYNLFTKLKLFRFVLVHYIFFRNSHVISVKYFV